MDETKIAKMIVEEQIQFVERMYEDILLLDVTKSKAKQIVFKIIDETARVCSGRMSSVDNIGIVDIKVNEMINESDRILSKYTKTIQDNNLSEKRIFEIVAQESQIELQKFYSSDKPEHSRDSSSNKTGCLGAASSFLLFVFFPIVLFFY